MTAKLLLVARYEYLRFIRRRSLLFAVFGVPVLLAVVIGAAALLLAGGEGLTVGYVDQAGVLREDALAGTPDEDTAEFRSFASVDAGRKALADEEVAALFVVPPDYPGDRTLQAFTAAGGLQTRAENAFSTFARAGLAGGAPQATAERLVEGPSVVVRTADGSREVEADAAFLYVILPFAAGLLFTIAAVTSGGYLLQAVSDEKENRTVEILATSVSPSQLIVGKTLGLVGVAATQLAVWGLGLAAALVVGARFIEPLAELETPWSLIAVVLVFFVPAYLLLAAVMVAIGSAFPEYRQSQQVVAVVNLLFFMPLFFTTMVFSDPNGPLAVALTFIPTTAFLTVLVRWAATAVPLWQLALAWVLLAASAALLVWAAPRIFRAGMLRYGQRLSFAAVRQALRQSGGSR